MLWVVRCHEGGAGVAGARAVWRWSAAQGLRALGCFVDAGWQDSRAVHDSRGPCSEKCPFLARSSRGVFPSGCLQGFSDAWRAYPAKASSFRMHGARILPRTGDFPVRDRFRDAWSAKLAMDRRPRTHRGGILPRQDPWERTAREYCHCQPGQERIRVQSRHRRMPKSASRVHFAIVERPGTHSVGIPPLPVVRSRSALHAREWVRSLGCAVGLGAQHFLCEGVGIPPSRGLTAGNDFESALFRWATMSPLRVLQSCAVLCAEAKSALTFI